MATSCSISLVDGGRYPLNTGTLYASRCNYEASLSYSQVIKDDGKYIRVVISGNYSVSYSHLSGYTMKPPNNYSFIVQDVSSNRYDSAEHSIVNGSYVYEYKYNVLSALNFKYRIYAWCQCVPQYVGKEQTEYLECVPSTTIGVSAISAVGADIGKTVNINIVAMDDSYTNNLYYKVGETTTTIAEGIGGGTVQWTIPTSLFNSLGATDKSIPIRLIVETFASNGVSLGQDIVDIAGYASEADCKPTLNPVFTITNPQTALTGNSSTAIVGYDTVSVAINPQTKYNATRTALSAKHGGTIVENSATPTFNVVNDSFQFSITDSRGYSTTQTATIPLVQWFKPTISMTATNPDATTNKSTITIKGTFFNSTFGAENNTVAIKVRWKEGNGTYSDWVDATATIKNNSVSATYEATLDYTKQWTIQASITDKLTTVLSKEAIVITLPVFDWSKSDFNFNVPVSSSKKFTSTGNSYGFQSRGTTGQDIGFYAEETDTQNRIAMEVYNGSVGLYMGHKGTWLIRADDNNVYINNKVYHPISIGTAAPSGGSDGDIYFKYS